MSHGPSLDARFCICGDRIGHGFGVATVSPLRQDPVQPLNRVHPPTTKDENSMAAADSMEPPAQRLRRLVYDLIEQRQPIATWEMEELLQMPGNTVRPRVWELHGAGLIERVGKNVAPSGRKAWTYAIVRP